MNELNMMTNIFTRLYNLDKLMKITRDNGTTYIEVNLGDGKWIGVEFDVDGNVVMMDCNDYDPSKYDWIDD